MSELNFKLPDGVTFNNVEIEENPVGETKALRKLSCPNCQFTVEAIIINNYGRYSGKIVINKNNEIWHGKLASDAEKSKKQILEIFNKKVKDHLDNCKG
jgi:hypothetical protein